MKIYLGMIVKSIVFIVLSLNMLLNPKIAICQNIENSIRNILLTSVHVGDPSKTEQILSYMDSVGASAEEARKILIEIIKEEVTQNKKTGKSHILVNFSVDILGNLNSNEAIPTLKSLLSSDNDNLKRRGIRAITKISSGIELVDFASQVRNDKKKYKDLDRYILYETLCKQLESKSHTVSKEKKNVVQTFLAESVDIETDSGNFILIDKTLIRIDVQYRKSMKRKKILKKFKASKTLGHKKYISEQLDNISITQ